MIRWRRKRRAQSDADLGLAQAQAAVADVAEKRDRMAPVLDRIEHHIADNAIYEAFRQTLRSAR